MPRGQEALSVGSLPEWQQKWHYAIGKRIQFKVGRDFYEGELRHVNATCTIARVKLTDGPIRDFPIELVQDWKLVRR